MFQHRVVVVVSMKQVKDCLLDYFLKALADPNQSRAYLYGNARLPNFSCMHVNEMVALVRELGLALQLMKENDLMGCDMLLMEGPHKELHNLHHGRSLTQVPEDIFRNCQSCGSRIGANGFCTNVGCSKSGEFQEPIKPRDEDSPFGTCRACDEDLDGDGKCLNSDCFYYDHDQDKPMPPAQTDEEPVHDGN